MRRIGLALLLLLPVWAGAQVTVGSGGSVTCQASAGNSGTVNAGTLNQLAYYAGAGTAVSGTSSVTGITLDGVSPTIMGYLTGLTSPVQTQLNSKQAALTLTTTGSGVATLSGGAFNIPTPNAIASVQISTGTTPIAAGVCTANTATVMTGATTATAIIPPTPSGASTNAVAGWGPGGKLSFSYYVTADRFNWSVCNNDLANPVTPGGAITWNVGAR